MRRLWSRHNDLDQRTGIRSRQLTNVTLADSTRARVGICKGGRCCTAVTERLAFLREVVTKPDRLARSMVLSMGGERLDTRNPTSKLMLTILAGVATCLLDASPQFLRRVGASHDGADRFSERHRVASMGVTAIMRVQGVCRKAKSAVGARKNRVWGLRLVCQTRLPRQCRRRSMPTLFASACPSPRLNGRCLQVADCNS